MRERQLAAAEHPSQHSPAAARLVEMKDVRELVGREQFERIARVEQIAVNRRVGVRDDAVRWQRRRGAVEDVALVNEYYPDLSSWSRAVRAHQSRVRRLGLRRGATRVNLQSGLEDQDEVRRL